MQKAEHLLTHTNSFQMIDKNTTEHYTWGQHCDGWHLIKSDTLSVIQESMPPHTSEIRHLHKHALQFFFVLTGQATIEYNGKVHILNTHQGLEVKPGVVHQVFNKSEQVLHFIVVSSPPSHGDRIQV